MTAGSATVAAAGPVQAAPATRTTLYGWIWRHSRRAQIAILAAILASLPFYFLSLDLPRQIVNGPIQGNGFAGAAATARHFSLPASLADLPLLDRLPQGGVELTRQESLVVLALLLLALVIVNGALKCAINIAKGRLGERMLRRLRFDLFDRLLVMSPAKVRRMKGAEVASAIKDEVEPLGGFVGEALATPLFLGGQALTAAAFIMLQNVWLGLIALVVVAIQGLLIPRLRRRLLELARERQQASRALAGRIAETVEGADEIRINQAADVERAGIAARLANIYRIRYAIYRRKFLIKFLNNWLAQLPPLLFFLIGGSFVLAGQLDLGQLLAVLVAYKDLPGPIAELIDWDYMRQDAELRFDLVQQYFAPAPDVPVAGAAEAGAGDGIALEVSGLALDGEACPEPVRGVSLAIRAGEHVGALADARSGAVAMAVAGLIAPTGGKIIWRGGASALRIGYAGEDPVLGQGTLRQALLYGLSRPPVLPGLSRTERRLAAEAAAAGTPYWPDHVDWIDHARLGTAPDHAAESRLIAALALVGFDDQLLAFALRRTIATQAEPALAEAILRARRRFSELLAVEGLDRLVAPFEPGRYNAEASIVDNLVFGQLNIAGGQTAFEGKSDFLARIAADIRLERQLLAIGIAMAAAATDLYGDLDAGNRLVRRQPFVPPESLAHFRGITMRLRGAGEPIDASARKELLELALGYVEPRHRLGLLTDRLRLRIVATRRRLRERLGGEKSSASITAFDPARYSDALSLEENIVFGVVIQSRADGPRRVLTMVRQALAESGALEQVLACGLGFEIGAGGRNLALAERQQIALARALLRQPDLLVVNRALSALGARAQGTAMTRILGDLRQNAPETAVFWVLAGAPPEGLFDRLLTMHDDGFEDAKAPAAPGPTRPGDAVHDD